LLTYEPEYGYSSQTHASLLCFSSMHSQLILQKLNLLVKLGHSIEERSLPQWISLRIKFDFSNLPAACINDQLNDTICYANLADELQQFCENHSFKLIEALAYQLYQFLKKKLSDMTNNKINIFLCITKNPQLTKIEQSSFSISD
jgi:7,8-dihydroneopterin aldolase/epimerase/oxygenase